MKASFFCPDFDMATHLASKAVLHIADRSYWLGYEPHVAYGELATRDNIEGLLAIEPELAVLTGHGDYDRLYGQGGIEVLWTCSNEYPRTIIYLLTCRAGRYLAPDMVLKGAKAVIGYEEAFMFASLEDATDPLRDPIARYFFEPVAEAVEKILRGGTAGEAYRHNRSRYEELADGILTTGRPWANAVAALLIHDSEVMVLEGNPNARVEAVPHPRVRAEEALIPIGSALLGYAVSGGNPLGFILGFLTGIWLVRARSPQGTS